MGRKTVQEISEIESKFNAAKKEVELAIADKDLVISSGGVKKTRNRLRKRLALTSTDPLEEHVNNFGNRNRQQYK